MFSVLTRTTARRCLRAPSYAARYASQAPPPSSESSPKDQDSASSKTTSSPDAATDAEPQPLRQPLPSLDVLATTDSLPPPPGGEQPGEGGQTGARSSDANNLTSSEKKRRNLSRAMMGLMLAGFGANLVWMGRDWEDGEVEERKVKREELPATRWGRTTERLSELFDYFNKPSWPELLPPPLPAPHQKPYTLLISIDDLLVTSTWDRQHGWRTAKRPGVDYFLAYLSQFYEVVVFTTQNYYTALPILENLDRYNFYITYKLFREATRSINGKIVKDLSFLNRDLSKVVTIDTSAEHTSTHPENAIVLPPWKGNPKDRDLVAMIPFLESIAIYKPNDVRPILAAYQGKDIAIEYAKNEAEAKRRHVEEWTKKKSGSGGMGFGGLLTGSTSSKPTIPPTYLELKRAEAQVQYKQEQDFITQHKDELEKLRKQDEEAAMGAAPGSLWDAISQMQGGVPGDGAQQGGQGGQGGAAGAPASGGSAAGTTGAGKA